MQPILLTNAQLFAETEILGMGYLLLEDGVVKAYGSMQKVPYLPDALVIQLAGGDRIVPGFIDGHIHGVAGADTMDGTAEALEVMTSQLPQEGTTAFLATTMTQSSEAIEQALKNVRDYRADHNHPGEAEIIGIHLEGPFINGDKAGAQPKEYVIKPDIGQFDAWQTLSGEAIRVVTVAPETTDALAFIEHLNQTGVVASLGHSNANYLQAKQAVHAGAKQVTHLFNAMTGLHHRDPGLAGAALLHKELKMELISDGIHVHPEMIRLAIRSKGVNGTLLITDAMRAKCLKNGQYTLGGQNVFVEDGEARLADGTLAGSVLRMADAFKLVSQFTDLAVEDVIQMVSVNPAKQFGVFDRKGSIAVGKDADVTVLDANFEIVLTICRGQLAYHKVR